MLGSQNRNDGQRAIGPIALGSLVLLGGAIGAIGLPTSQAIAQTQPSTTPNVLRILQGLPQPIGSPANRPALFSANAYGQQSLNFQGKSTPEAAVQFYRQALGKLGYTERTINASIGTWGFSIVFDPPASLGLKPTRPTAQNTLQVGDQLTVQGAGTPSVALVLQGTMLAPDTININIRFEEL